MTLSTVVITGAASGIGLAVARHLHVEGRPVLMLDKDGDLLAGAASGLGARFHVVDVLDAESLSACLSDDVERHGEIGGVVTSAGLTRIGEVKTMPASDWRLVLDVNLTGTFLTCQAAIPHLEDGASIVTLGSIAGQRPLVGRAAYSAAKAAVESLTRTMAAELAPRRTRANCVAPGWVDTPFLRAAAAAGQVDLDELAQRPPIHGLVPLDRVVAVISFLLSARSDAITGQTIHVDNGWVHAC